MDISVAAVIIFVISFTSFNINRNSINKAAKEADENLRLKKRLELQVKDKNLKLETFKSFVDAAGQGLGMSDIEGNIVFCNGSMVKIMKLENEINVIGKKLHDFYTEETWTRLKYEIFPEVIKNGIWHGNLFLKTRTGETVLTENNFFVIKDGQGKSKFIANAMSDITEKESIQKELAQANKMVKETSRLAGSAEVATGVLHNVGNLLNSVGITSSRVKEEIKKSRMAGIVKLSDLVEKNKENIDEFLKSEKGKKILPYIKLLAEIFGKEKGDLVSLMDKLILQIEHMTEVIRLQQSLGGTTSIKELVSLDTLIKDAIKIEDESMVRHKINLNYTPSKIPDAFYDKHRVLQILINLIRNAKHALDESHREDKTISINVKKKQDDLVVIELEDNGIGIAEENVDKIFEYGFTTKDDGHGFGLHYCINAAKEMGGLLSFHSNGHMEGCRFTLELPYKQDD